MKISTSTQLKYLFLTFALFLFNGLAMAQDKIEIEPEEVENWFQRNQLWVYIGAGVLLLLIIIASSGGSRRTSKKTTTVVRDKDGFTERVTTTEEEI